MSEINGVQLARLWARAWKDPIDKDGFRRLLETNPRQAAKNFRDECITNKYAAFPDLSADATPLLNLEEYEHATVIFKDMHPDRLEEIIRSKKKGKEEVMEVPWTMSKFLSPRQVREKLLKGEFEIY